MQPPERVDHAPILSRPIVALPYDFEIHDIVPTALQRHPSDMTHRRGLDRFECLYEASVERPKIMAVACRPCLSGMPHRVGHVRRPPESVMGRDGVAVRDGARIPDRSPQPCPTP